MKTLILSDLHLGSKHCTAPLVHEVLDQVPFDRLILNGDTIHSVNFRKLSGSHWGLLERLRDLGRERELILVRGNHDHETDYQPRLNGSNPVCGTHSVLPGLLGVPMVEDYRLDVGDRKYLVLHGDHFDPTLHYPAITEVAGFCYHLATKIHKKLAKWLKKKSKRWGGVLEVVRQQSVAYARQRGVAGVICGHTHFPEDTQVNDVHYINTGCWTESPCSYVTVHNGELALHQLAN